jgi:hypothetical protein
VSATFVAAQLLPAMGWDAAAGERWACFGTWLACALWTAWRPPLRAAQELLWLAAIVTALVPLAHGFASGWWIWRSVAAGHGALAAVDIGALVMAIGFAALARATSRRGRHVANNSVWANTPTGSLTRGTG